MGATGKGVHLNQPLSNIAIAYRPENMIADQICPIVPVDKQSDNYYIWQIADAFRITDDKRAPATEANVLDRNISSGTYFADNYALKDRIPYEDIENADAGFMFTERTSRVEFLKDRLMLNMEYRVAKQCTSGSNVGSYSACASAWTDYTNSDPILDIETAIANVEDATGTRPNSILFGRNIWRHFRKHDDVLSRIFGYQTTNNGRIVTSENVKALFELERVLIGGAYQNTAGRGQTASLSGLWADHVLVYYAPMTPRKDKPSFMYGFRWNKIMNMQAFIYQLPKSHAEEVELGYYQDEVITASALGFLILNCTSSTA